MCKQAWCTCKVVVLLIKPSFFNFPVAVHVVGSYSLITNKECVYGAHFKARLKINTSSLR